MSPKNKKPTMKEMEKVVNNIIHDLQILNNKIESSLWGLRHYIEFTGKNEEFGVWLNEQSKELEKMKEKDERNQSIETSDKTDNKSDSKGESVGSVPKS